MTDYISNAEVRDIQARDAERLILGTVLWAPERLPEAMALVQSDHFRIPHHQALFEWLVGRLTSGMSLDFAMVIASIAEQGLSNRFGGVGYVSELEPPSTRVELSHLAEVVVRRWQRSRLLALSRALAVAAEGEPCTYDGDAWPADPVAVAHNAGAVCYELAQQRPTQRDETIGAAARRAVADRKAAAEAGKPVMMTTGFADIDARVKGMKRKSLWGLAARPSMGKTALALEMALRQDEKGLVAGVISIEMPSETVGDRGVALLSNEDLGEIITGKCDDDDEINAWRDALDDSRVLVHDPEEIDVPGIVAKACAWKARHGLDVLYIDYLGLIEHPAADRHDLRVGKTMKALKALAKRLDICVVILIQLNRKVEERISPKLIQQEHEDWWLDVKGLPNMGDLRDSGQIEMVLDVCGFPLRAERLNVDTKIEACCLFDKNRNGPTGTVGLRWVPQSARYTDRPSSGLL